MLCLLAAAGCATAPATRGGPDIARALGVPERTDAGTGTAIPPGIALDDGLTQDEAVAVALWNNPDFRLQLTDLGFARADLLEAGLLRNPVLSILFPLGPKQFEATLRFPIEVLWERPRRVAAAGIAVNRVAMGLEQFGLNLVADVKVGFVELALARDRAQLSEAAAQQLEEIQRITEARLRAGDISELEARTAAIDAARARQDAARAVFDVQIRENALRARLGLALEAAPVALVPAPAAAACADTPDEAAALLKDALAARPDVRAAEIAVEAAAARMGWERARIISVTAVLDANGEGKSGFEWGPGLDLSVPLFDRNQAGRTRAAMELQRAGLVYLGARQRVATALTDSLTLLSQARTTQGSWQQTIVAPLAEQVRAAERAFAAGDVSYLFVLEITRRLTDAQLRAREVDADVARASVRMERAIGRTCGAKGITSGD
jgi:cobalt-zinc-cadmium efflux system outer membrane protein